jgi:hypothetical protein
MGNHSLELHKYLIKIYHYTIYCKAGLSGVCSHVGGLLFTVKITKIHVPQENVNGNVHVQYQIHQAWLQTPDNPALQLQLANCLEPVSLVKIMCNVYWEADTLQWTIIHVVSCETPTVKPACNSDSPTLSRCLSSCSYNVYVKIAI